MRIERPDMTKVLGMTGFVLSTLFILSILIK